MGNKEILSIEQALESKLTTVVITDILGEYGIPEGRGIECD